MLYCAANLGSFFYRQAFLPKYVFSCRIYFKKVDLLSINRMRLGWKPRHPSESVIIIGDMGIEAKRKSLKRNPRSEFHTTIKNKILTYEAT